MRGPYFVGKPCTRHITAKTAVARINERIQAGDAEVPVWVGGIYGDPLATVSGPITILELARRIKIARRAA